MQPGDRVTHRRYGPGTITGRDMAHEFYTKERGPHGKVSDTGRLAVHFDTHPELPDPAYFWPQELKVLTEETP